MPGKTQETKQSNMTSILPGIPTVAASCTRVLLGHPLDTIAKNLQIQQGASNYAFIMQALKEKIDRKKGLKKFMAFYPGFPVAVLYKGTQLTLFELMNPWKESVKEYISHPMTADLATGISMALAQTTILQPLNVFKTRLQVGFANYTWPAFKTEMSSGLGATYGRNVAFLATAAVASTQLENLTRHFYYPDQTGDVKLTPNQKQNICILSGAIAVFPCMPWDVLKTRRQAWSSVEVKPGLTTMANNIRKNEGVKVLFKGSMAYVVAELVGLCGYFKMKQKVSDLLSDESKVNKTRSIPR